MTHPILVRLEKIFDSVETAVESHAGHRAVGALMVTSFLGTLLAIQLKRQGVLPSPLANMVPDSYLASIELTFTLLLFVEVVALILTISRSISSSVGKQFELLSLILLRDVFKELSHLGEPITWDKVLPALSAISASAAGALAIFVILAFYYRTLCRRPIARDHMEQKTFIAAKKCVALVLLCAFLFIVAQNILGTNTDPHQPGPFESLYTLLIFTDVLLVLLSLRYSSSYHVAFRNSGFAVATVMIRFTLIAPPLIGAGLGAGTALFALAIIVAYNYFSAVMAKPCNLS